VTERQATPTTGEGAESHSPVVVGVDGSDRNRCAVRWAAEEAVRSGADLRLVAVATPDDDLLPLVHRGPTRAQAERALEHARSLVDDLVPREQLFVETVTGPVEDALIASARDGRLLTVGKRGLHAIPRLLVGSTSLAVAGRAPVAVAVVPDTWDQAARATGPVVVGVDPRQQQHRLLHLVFRRAERLGLRLVAVHGWEPPPPADGHDAADEARAHDEADLLLDTWRARFPDVEVEVRHSALHPAMAILDAAEDASVVALGRHAASRFSGFGFGSVTRAVLHYAECPVLVIPTDD
jgi:nucleotide-binding universal stress UspA family protein